MTLKKFPATMIAFTLLMVVLGTINDLFVSSLRTNYVVLLDIIVLALYGGLLGYYLADFFFNYSPIIYRKDVGIFTIFHSLQYEAKHLLISLLTFGLYKPRVTLVMKMYTVSSYKEPVPVTIDTKSEEISHHYEIDEE